MERTVLNIFIASPSDLAEERKLLRSIVDRTNHSVGRQIGWHIDLVGWEDTLPGYARPQSLINKDVDSCDLFIGMLWQRWGQPTGEHSSGFEEEFLRARSRRQKSETPEIWLLFKSPDENALKDPGEQLKRVLQFREEQELKKELLYKEFKTTEDFSRTIHDDLVAYILRIHQQLIAGSAMAELAGVEAAESSSSPEQGVAAESGAQSYPEGLINLFSHVAMELPNKGTDNIDFWHRTRLLLVANTWFAERHAVGFFGVHEMNLVFRKRNEWELSDAERWFLLRSVIGDSSSHRPGWSWIRSWQDQEVDAALEILASTDPESSVRKNALALLQEAGHRPQRDFLESCLHDKDSDVVIQAINLLRHTGDSSYLDLLDDLTKSTNPKISGAASLTQLELLYIKEPDRAFEELINQGLRMPDRISADAESLKLPVSPGLLMKAWTAPLELEIDPA